MDRLSSLKDQEINEAKKVAAFEITKLIHGEEAAIKAEAPGRWYDGGGCEAVSRFENWKWQSSAYNRAADCQRLDAKN